AQAVGAGDGRIVERLGMLRGEERRALRHRAASSERSQREKELSREVDDRWQVGVGVQADEEERADDRESGRTDDGATLDLVPRDSLSEQSESGAQMRHQQADAREQQRGAERSRDRERDLLQQEARRG